MHGMLFADLWEVRTLACIKLSKRNKCKGQKCMCKGKISNVKVKFDHKANYKWKQCALSYVY